MVELIHIMVLTVPHSRNMFTDSLVSGFHEQVSSRKTAVLSSLMIRLNREILLPGMVIVVFMPVMAM